MKLSLLFLLIFTMSCNVVKMIEQGKTDVPDEFFDGHRHEDGPRDNYIVYICDSTWYCIFDTETHTLTKMFNGSGTAPVIADTFAMAGDYIYYTNNGSVRKFNPSNQVEVDLAQAITSNLTSLGNSIFFSDNNSPDRLVKYDGQSFSFSSSGVFSSGRILMGLHDNLVACKAGDLTFLTQAILMP